MNEAITAKRDAVEKSSTRANDLRVVQELRTKAEEFRGLVERSVPAIKRLADAEYPGAVRVLTDIETALDDSGCGGTPGVISGAIGVLLAAGGDEGAYLYEDLVIGWGLTLAGAEAEIREFTDELGVDDHRVDLLLAHARTRTLPTGADAAATSAEAVRIAFGKLRAAFANGLAPDTVDRLSADLQAAARAETDSVKAAIESGEQPERRLSSLESARWLLEAVKSEETPA